MPPRAPAAQRSILRWDRGSAGAPGAGNVWLGRSPVPLDRFHHLGRRPPLDSHRPPFPVGPSPPPPAAATGALPAQPYPESLPTPRRPLHVPLLCGEEGSSCRRPAGSARAALLEAEGGLRKPRVKTSSELQAASRRLSRARRRQTSPRALIPFVR